ncbi:hypothetical protein IV203_008331 [Nitzschia inconspicua]|uniref:Uncharacterized protein n=1 Tax=Nitzschia inconspicua TaxID=303405 RepID=A0A9K3KYJ6_9STRA|nr:hypothetical protein IV203_008331 [Nitzschia inconspicua]
MALLSPFMAFPSKSVLPKPARILAFHGPAIAFHGNSLKIGFAPTCEDISLFRPCYRLSWHFPQNWFCPNLGGYWPFMALLSPFMAFPSTSVLPQPTRISAFFGPAIVFHGTPLKIGSAPTCEDIGLSWPCYRLSWHFPQHRFCPNLRGYQPFSALLSPFMALPSKSVLPQPARILAFHGPAIAFHGTLVVMTPFILTVPTPLTVGSAPFLNGVA